MVLTRNFKETIRACIEREPSFREEAVESLLSGKAVLCDYINATTDF